MQRQARQRRQQPTYEQKEDGDTNIVHDESMKSSLPIGFTETYSDEVTVLLSSRTQQVSDLSPPLTDDEAESSDESSWTSKPQGDRWEPPDLPDMDEC